MYRLFSGAQKKAIIDKLKFHDRKHTFLRHAMYERCILDGSSGFAGHKTMNMTMRYAHISKDHKKKAINLLHGLTGRKD